MMSAEERIEYVRWRNNSTIQTILSLVLST